MQVSSAGSVNETTQLNWAAEKDAVEPRCGGKVEKICVVA